MDKWTAERRPLWGAGSGRRRRLHVRRAASRVVFFLLLLGLAYLILFPFVVKILASFMSEDDLYDPLVALIPRHFSLAHYQTVIQHEDFLPGLFNTALYALAVGLGSVFSSSLVGYSLARYRYPGSRLLFGLVIATMLIPLITLSVPMYAAFQFFDIFGLIEAFGGKGITLTNTVWPLVILSATGLGFRGGIYIFLMRQVFKGLPDEIVEAAKVDGAGHFRIFWKVALPSAQSMLVVIFVLAFAWQWTDTFYTTTLMTDKKLLPNLVLLLSSASFDAQDRYLQVVQANAALLLCILPLILVYVLFQRKIIQGIERSGLVG